MPIKLGKNLLGIELNRSMSLSGSYCVPLIHGTSAGASRIAAGATASWPT